MNTVHIAYFGYGLEEESKESQLTSATIKQTPSEIAKLHRKMYSSLYKKNARA